MSRISSPGKGVARPLGLLPLIFLFAVHPAAGGAGRAEVPVQHLDGMPFVRLHHLAHFYGIEANDRPVTLGDALHRFEFEPKTRRALYNGEVVWLHEAPVRRRNGWYISQPDHLTLVDPLLRSRDHLRRTGSGPVLLDPGHGGNDSGARGQGGLTEKELTLDVANRIHFRLVGQGVEAYFTRDGDRFVSLDDRGRAAADRRAALLVSVHFNQASNAEASGVETYVMPESGQRSTSGMEDKLRNVKHSGNRFDGANMILARSIHHQLLRTLQAQDRGIRRARFVVLRDATCPAVLVECGFISNSAEREKIRTPAYRASIAAAIALGILDYVKAVEKAKSANGEVALPR